MATSAASLANVLRQFGAAYLQDYALSTPQAKQCVTLPRSLNGLYGAHPHWVIDMLFASAAQTLSEFAANPKWMGIAKGTPPSDSLTSCSPCMPYPRCFGASS